MREKRGFILTEKRKVWLSFEFRRRHDVNFFVFGFGVWIGFVRRREEIGFGLRNGGGEYLRILCVE